MTLLASSSANDQLTRFSLDLQSLALVNKAGSSVPLISGTQQVEFMHLNGLLEPIVTVDIPQDTYTSATATVSDAGFTCATQLPDSDDISTFYSRGGTGTVTVQLPQPVAISGSSMALSLDILVSKSATLPSTCYVPGGSDYSISPTFDLTALDTSAAPVTTTELKGLVQAVGPASGSFTVTAAGANPTGGLSVSQGVTWRVSTSSATVFQGIGSAAGVLPGMAVDFDGSLQSDGTLLATRLAVPDPDTTNLMVNTGPLIVVPSAVQALTQVNQETEGSIQYLAGNELFSYGNSMFATWSGLTNLSSLPFPATFTSTNMVAGQMVSITSHVTTAQQGPVYVPAATMTLMPQTIDGQVTATRTAGAFTTYTVQLAPYSLFPTFATQPGQTTVLTNPQQVVVYADQNTKVASSTQPGPGGTFRFYGVVFNDSGTLRMDCLQISDGVAQ